MRKKFNFDDLVFTKISPSSRVTKASLSFKNGLGCNIYMHSNNTNLYSPYEFELTKNGEHFVDNHLSDDNVGYCTKDEICQLISEAQRL